MPSFLRRVTSSFKDGFRPEDALDRRRRDATLLASTEARFAKLEADLLVVKCLVGAVLAGVILLLVRAFM